MTIKCIETSKIENPEIFANLIYNNFIYLEPTKHLSHNKQEILKTLKLDKNLCFLVYDNDTLVGYLVGDFKVLNDQRKVYYISYFFIMEAYRSHGIGSQVMDMVKNKCKSLNIPYILLTYDSNDNKLTKFYNKHGFTLDKSLGTLASKRHIVMCLKL